MERAKGEKVEQRNSIFLEAEEGIVILVRVAEVVLTQKMMFKESPEVGQEGSHSDIWE